MLENLDNGNMLSRRVLVADTFWGRFLGLMGRKQMPPDEALLLLDCSSVHTFFMRFPIDIAYLDRGMRVLAVYPDVKPWRVVPQVEFGAHTLELPAGTLTSAQTAVGHRLAIMPPH